MRQDGGTIASTYLIREELLGDGTCWGIVGGL